MELISCLTLYYFWTALFCSRGHAHEEEAVAFVRHACRYRHHYIQSPLNMKDECKRLTCSISVRTLTVEVCADSGSNNNTCHMGNVPKKRFPFCCQSCSSRENMTIIDVKITHYTADGAPGSSDYAPPVKSTGHWSAPAKYIFGACRNGTCHYRGQRIIRETKLNTPCTSVKTYKRNTYIRVEKCPLFPESELTNCTKLNDGDKNNRYPYCCPLYMCPPRGRERRNSTEWEHPEWHKGMCKYGGNAFANYFSSYAPCRTAICHTKKRAVEVVTCLHKEDLNWTQCRAVVPVKRKFGNHPVCCPDYLCPDMKVRRLPLPETFTSRVQLAASNSMEPLKKVVH
ncbi:uncharacterized protein LOC142803361 isoform X2 [Rhipicephalus microplus]|uniref:uncharacterized protein LOC142803361 isoform X2 n=1 Tax=Rhipicephalus microplus TaxID=6941 RepID=UPI003F6C2A26